MSSEFSIPNKKENIDSAAHKIANPNRKCNGRSQVVEADLYYKVLDENINLKKRHLELEKEMKKLQVNIRSSQNRATSVKGIDPVKSELQSIEVEQLRVEVDNGTSKNAKMKTIIAGLQKELLKKGGKTNKAGLSSANDSSDAREIISHLRENLKAAHEEKKSLIDDLIAMKESRSGSITTDYSNDISDKTRKGDELTRKYEKGCIQIETNKNILKGTKESLDEYIEKFTLERNKNRDGEIEIESLQATISKVDEYATIIEEYKRKEAELEERITSLCQNPFINQLNKRENAFEQLKEKEIAGEAVQRRFQELQNINCEQAYQLKELQLRNDEGMQERDQYKEGELRHKIKKEELEKKYISVDDQFKRGGKLGEIDSTYSKMVNQFKNNLISPQAGGEENEWMNIDFLEKPNKNPQDIQTLGEENERLKIEKGILGKEGEKTITLLQIEQKINQELSAMRDCDNKKFELETNKLNDQIREGSQHVNNSHPPKQFNEEVYNNLKYSLQSYHQLHEKPSLEANITEFSRVTNESMFTNSENAVDLFLGKAKIDLSVLKSHGSIDANTFQSLVAVDFYLHDTQTSNLTNGFFPNYNFQLSFRVIENEMFIKYLQSKQIVIEGYYIGNDKEKKILAKGEIELNKLIKAESNLKTRVVRDFVKLFLIDKSVIEIGTISYKIRLRSSIARTLEYFEEKQKVENQLSPGNKINSRPMESNNYFDSNDQTNLNNVYAYDVKILIHKAVNIRITGSKTLNPFIYYKFYDRIPHYSDIFSGIDSLFDDCADFINIVNDTQLTNYIEKSNLIVYLFDHSDPLEVSIDKEAEILNTKDLIGYTEIKGLPLLTNNKIEGMFPIISDENNETVGHLSVDISWKQKIRIRNYSLMSNDEVIDLLLIQFAAYGREVKKGNRQSAFNIYDTDHDEKISITDFKSEVTFEFTKDVDTLNHLTKIIFKEKIELTRADFYEVFKYLLPSEEDRDSENLRNNNTNNEQDFRNRQFNSNTNQSIDVNQSAGKESQNYNGNNQSDNIYRVRTKEEIIQNIKDYLIKFGKKTAIDVFKGFDQDANGKVGKNEMANGFKKICIDLLPMELEMIWNDIVKNSKSRTNFDYTMFKEFYDIHNFLGAGEKNKRYV